MHARKHIRTHSRIQTQTRVHARNHTRRRDFRHMFEICKNRLVNSPLSEKLCSRAGWNHNMDQHHQVAASQAAAIFLHPESNFLQPSDSPECLRCSRLSGMQTKPGKSSLADALLEPSMTKNTLQRTSCAHHCRGLIIDQNASL